MMLRSQLLKSASVGKGLRISGHLVDDLPQAYRRQESERPRFGSNSWLSKVL